MSLIRTDWYCALLKIHPIFEWAANQHYAIDRMALAQHYELPTGLIDLTESIEVALFFACCECLDGKWQPRDRGRGILYRLGLADMHESVSARVGPIGLQPFHRPHAQWAWTIKMSLGEDLEELPGIEAVVFNHTRQIGEQLLHRFNDGQLVMPLDPLYDWAVAVKRSQSLPHSHAVSVVEDIAADAGGIKVTNMSAFLDDVESATGVTFETNVPSSILSPSPVDLKAKWASEKQDFTERMKGRVILVKSEKPDEKGKRRA